MNNNRNNNYRNNRPQQKKYPHRINSDITSPMVRIVGPNVDSKIVSSAEALKLAQSMEMDLVEISPSAEPPVCKIVDYKKFLYDKEKEEKERKKNSKQMEIKEIRLTQNTDEHDLDFKCKHAANFLKEGNKVKCSINFKGREIIYKERAELVMLKFAEKVGENGVLEYMPKMEGNKMHMVINPKKQK